MRKIISLLLILAMTLGLACAMAEDSPMLAGGWAAAEDPTVTEEINNAFQIALDSYETGTVTVAYTPVALLGTQVVAGMNYAILCRAQEINQRPVWVIAYVYQDLEGNASILKMADLPLGV